MSLFTPTELEQILKFVKENSGNILVTFRHKFGPTKLKELWTEVISQVGSSDACVSWWTSAGSIGLLECEIRDGVHVYGQWVLGDENKLIGIFKVEDDDVLNIRDGFDAGVVTSAAMRAMRIGETGGEKE
ncbi:MAG: hypothetical protein ACTSUB_02765 [Candidatus Thorarchaeota archaeon]